VDFWDKLLNTAKTAFKVEVDATAIGLAVGSALGVPEGGNLYDILKLQATLTLQNFGIMWGTDPQDATTILDDTLNAAAVGTLTQEVTFLLVGGIDSLPVPWLNGVGTLTPFGTFNDANIVLPTIQGGNEIEIVEGAGSFTIIFDTDAGATKTYQLDDFMGTILASILTIEGVLIGLQEAITFNVNMNS
jgi:hypothetical protein